MKRDFYVDYADSTYVDDYISGAAYDKYAYYLPQHMGGTRRSKRFIQNEILRLIDMGEEAVSEISLRSSVLRLQRLQDSLFGRNDKSCDGAATSDTVLHNFVTTTTQNTVTQQNTAEPTQTQSVPTPEPAQPQQQIQLPQPAAAAPAQQQEVHTPPTPDEFKPSKRRRYIQFIFEMMGCPPEHFPDGTKCWDGPDGIINKIRDLLGLRNTRARQQIRNVLSYIQDCMDQGISDFDAGNNAFLI